MLRTYFFELLAAKLRACMIGDMQIRNASPTKHLHCLWRQGHGWLNMPSTFPDVKCLKLPRCCDTTSKQFCASKKLQQEAVRERTWECVTAAPHEKLLLRICSKGAWTARMVSCPSQAYTWRSPIAPNVGSSALRIATATRSLHIGSTCAPPFKTVKKINEPCWTKFERSKSLAFVHQSV